MEIADFNIDEELFAPKKRGISEDNIASLGKLEPRRFKLADFSNPLESPRCSGEGYKLSFPFEETFAPCFNGCCKKENIGFRKYKGAKCKVYTYLNALSAGDATDIEQWIKLVSKYVAIRDFLSMTFALDYDKKSGNPDNEQTKIGKLRSRAKPYGQTPTKDTYNAADELVTECVRFLSRIECYLEYSDVIVAVPSSHPKRQYNLPRYLAKNISDNVDKPDYSENVKSQKHKEIKDASVAEKLTILKGTIQVDKEVFKNKGVILLDDLYQSGATMNYVAMKLLEAGAKRVMGLACEKTCRNDDNTATNNAKR